MKYFYNYLFIFSFSFFIFFSSGFLDSQDGLQYLTIARRIYYDATVEMPEASYKDGQKNIHMNVFTTADGKTYPATGLGYSLAMIPAVALEDIFLSSQGLKPLRAFPLEKDWPVLLFASFTNAFFGALLVVFLSKYLSLFLNRKQSAFLSFLFVISTNLFVYTKHSFAHMMFTSFLMVTFYYLKVFFIKHKKIYLILSVMAYGVVMLSYNGTYIFALPAIGIFYLLHRYLDKTKILLEKIKLTTLDLIISALTLFPFYLLNNWYLSFRNVGELSQQVKFNYLTWLKPYVFFEGLWGILFSPGKSIFLFSPILLLLILFWFKFDIKKHFKELISFSTLFFTYLFFIATSLGGPDFMLWHGDSSYGNRYMVTTLPFLLILVALIYKKMSKKAKIFVFYPLILIGLLIQIPGVLLPYQLRFGGLESETKLNGRRLTVSEYGSFIPRYSPVFSMSKILAKRIVNIDSYLFHGPHNLRLVDGFDYPFDLGWTIWRTVYPKAEITTNNNDSINKISLQIKNHQIDPTSSYSARVTINGIETIIDIENEKIIEVTADDYSKINIESSLIATSSTRLPKKQELFLQALWINDVPQTIATIDYPYVSPFSKSLLDINYSYWGDYENDPWALWHMHSGVYEQTFDVWWLRPFHYWDLPKEIYLFGIINFAVIIYTGYFLLKID